MNPYALNSTGAAAQKPDLVPPGPHVFFIDVILHADRREDIYHLKLGTIVHDDDTRKPIALPSVDMRLTTEAASATILALRKLCTHRHLPDFDGETPFHVEPDASRETTDPVHGRRQAVMMRTRAPIVFVDYLETASFYMNLFYIQLGSTFIVRDNHKVRRSALHLRLTASGIVRLVAALEAVF
ncbi:hypothetical protein KGY14_06860 [Ameyamaea chiangmaiensis]|uniref:Uncharacterized protein n=1 Tax=Ameyamaea chiangmaiensis TaxID=442969 RepID=A0A850P844_9PROT|nr:hypothetical protein [Ameyamaea chiangmaiensis]MBS4074909.1 hypothetical protein [Ameyamaea chiangmaiensis]NVN40785.1 hypothetical protein [Ameyamaea chiangmaiensis]